MTKAAKITAAIAALMMTAPAFAHVGHDGPASFSTGFLHPLTGYDHLTALILIGLFAAGYNARNCWKILACFAVALMGGFAVGVEWANAHQAEALVSLSLLALPVALWAYRKQGMIQLVSMAAIFAFSACHGLVQGAEAIGNVAGFGFGSLVSSLMVVTVVMLVSRVVMGRVKAIRLKAVQGKTTH